LQPRLSICCWAWTPRVRGRLSLFLAMMGVRISLVPQRMQLPGDPSVLPDPLLEFLLWNCLRHLQLQQVSPEAKGVSKGREAEFRPPLHNARFTDFLPGLVQACLYKDISWSNGLPYKHDIGRVSVLLIFPLDHPHPDLVLGHLDSCAENTQFNL
jgi:hypothetical protein